MSRRHLVALALVVICGRLARADDPAFEHEHAHHADGDDVQIGASVALVAADYENRLFSGDYQGVVPGASISHGRFSLAVKVPAYRIVENGREVRGLGDVMVHAHASIFTRRDLSAGLMLMTTAPTGEARAGLGMGHVMLMPEAWCSWSPASVSLTGALGFGYAFGGASAHASHGGGMWPLVDPMNAQQLTYATSALFPLARQLAVGVRLRGATPIGTGEDWMIGGAAVVWRARRIQTSLDIQHGLIGDPFGMRGTLETAISF